MSLVTGQNKIANPAKKFDYIIEMNGFPFATCQSFDPGELEIAADEHGDGNKDIYTPGRVKVPVIIIEKLTPIDVPENYFWDWMEDASSQLTGGRLPASVIKQDFVCFMHDGEGIPIKQWVVSGAWPMKCKPSKLGDKEEGNYMETVTLRPDSCVAQAI